jgi:hypothetical protein
MFGIKPKLMQGRFELTYFYDLLTYLNTIRAKVVMIGVKQNLMKGRFELTYFHELMTCLMSCKTVRPHYRDVQPAPI